MQKFFKLLGKALANCIGAVLVCSLIAAFAYISVRNVVAESNGDFGMFWQVGHKFVINDIAPIYAAAPKATAESPLDPYLVYFWYPPHLAVMCIPLGLLPLKASMGVFIAVQVLALLLASFLFSTSINAAGQSAKKSMLATSIAATTFLPMGMSISLGQPGVLIAFLPITAAYVAMAKKRYLLAGLILGALVLKPQFLLPLALLAIACVLAAFKARRQARQQENHFLTSAELVKLAQGFLLTASVFIGFGLSIFGAEGYLRWMERLKTSVDFVYAHTGYEGYQEPYELISSLSMAIAFQCQNVPTAIVKGLTSLFLFGAGLLVIFLLYRIASSSLSNRLKLDLTLITALLSLPVISPYFRLYDLGLVVLAGWIILFGPAIGDKKVHSIAKLLTIAFWLFVDFRCLLIPQEMALKLTWINAVFVAGVAIYWLAIALMLQPRAQKKTQL